MYDDGSWWGGWWIIMSLSMVVFWVLVIAGIVALVNYFGKRESEETPEQTLARRLAAGEIDQEQYRALRDELRGRPQGPSAAFH